VATRLSWRLPRSAAPAFAGEGNATGAWKTRGCKRAPLRTVHWATPCRLRAWTSLCESSTELLLGRRALDVFFANGDSGVRSPHPSRNTGHVRRAQRILPSPLLISASLRLPARYTCLFVCLLARRGKVCAPAFTLAGAGRLPGRRAYPSLRWCCLPYALQAASRARGRDALLLDSRILTFGMCSKAGSTLLPWRCAASSARA